MSMASEATARNAAAITVEQQQFAVRIGKGYLRRCQREIGFGTRYGLEEYLRLQGVSAVLIPRVKSIIQGAYETL